MKRSLLVLFFISFSLIGYNSYAIIHFEVKWLPNTSIISFATDSDADWAKNLVNALNDLSTYRFSYWNFGIGVSMFRRLPIYPEATLMYISKGSVIHTSGFSILNLTGELKNDYLQLDLVGKIKVAKCSDIVQATKGINLYILAGIYNSFLLSSKAIYYKGDHTEEVDLLNQENENDWPFTRYDMGIVVGAGFSLNILQFSFSIETRYNYGLYNMFAKEGQEQETATIKGQNRNLYLNVGFGVGF